MRTANVVTLFSYYRIRLILYLSLLSLFHEISFLHSKCHSVQFHVNLQPEDERSALSRRHTSPTICTVYTIYITPQFVKRSWICDTLCVEHPHRKYTSTKILCHIAMASLEVDELCLRLLQNTNKSASFKEVEYASTWKTCYVRHGHRLTSKDRH